MEQNYFTGTERLEVFAGHGRAMRMGTPQELKVTDLARVLEALEAKDPKKAEEYLTTLHVWHGDMVQMLIEWTLRWSESLAKVRTSEEERACTKLACEIWTTAASTIGSSVPAKKGLALCAEVLTPVVLHPTAGSDFAVSFSQGKTTAADGIYRELKKFQAENFEKIRSGDFKTAIMQVDDYWKFFVAIHDAFAQFAQTYPIAVIRLFGQPLAEKMVHDSFSTATFFEGLWGLVTSLKPKPLAAFLAEHLRIHMAGDNRGGGVEVVEETDRYRVVFDPCGSGGALRRRHEEHGTEVGTFPDASPVTWSRAGEVPPYCSHCALNELQSSKRVGYPMFVTEFDPEASRPCGWTVYKDPDLIPERIFKQIGLEKDPAKFKRPK